MNAAAMDDSGPVPRPVYEYLRQLEATLLGSPEQEEILSRIRLLPGGIRGAISFIGVGLPAAFNPELAAGETGIVTFLLTADGEQIELHVEIAPDHCQVLPSCPRPTTIIEMPAAIFLQVAFKERDGNDAYVEGLVNADGDIVLATSFGEWFDRPHADLVTRAQELGVTDELSLAGPLAWLAGTDAVASQPS